MSPDIAVKDILTPIVQDVFATMVNCPAEPAAAPAPIEGARVTAFVGIAGSRRYTVLLECGEPLACKAAGAMLMDEFPAWSDGVQDAVSEIANMVAGNVKSKLPDAPSLSLSLPTVVRGSSYECRTPRMTVLGEAGFVCAGLPLAVHIVEEEA